MSSIEFKNGGLVSGYREMGEVVKSLSKKYKDSGVIHESLQTTASVIINAAKDLGYSVIGLTENEPLTIFYYPKDGLHLMIPDIDDLNASIPVPYPLPHFYLAGHVLESEELRLHRIGEYTCQKCL